MTKKQRTSPANQTCTRCGDSVAPGSGKLVNRVPDGDSEGGYICEDCDSAPYCTTCGSEIVETVNDSAFCDGECGPCEYLRYKTQPEVLEVLDRLLDLTLDQDLAVGNELTEKETDARERALALLEKVNGKEA